MFVLCVIFTNNNNNNLDEMCLTYNCSILCFYPRNILSIFQICSHTCNIYNITYGLQNMAIIISKPFLIAPKTTINSCQTQIRKFAMSEEQDRIETESLCRRNTRGGRPKNNVAFREKMWHFIIILSNRTGREGILACIGRLWIKGT